MLMDSLRARKRTDKRMGELKAENEALQSRTEGTENGVAAAHAQVRRHDLVSAALDGACHAGDGQLSGTRKAPWPSAVTLRRRTSRQHRLPLPER